MLDEIPPLLASFGEGCNCHEPWASHLSPAARGQLLQAHYGKGIHTCPMAGMRAPEIVCGGLTLAIQEIWQTTEAKILTIPLLPKASPLSSREWELLISDFKQAQDLLLSLFRIKTAFWNQLPHLLVGLANNDEGLARDCAASIVEVFDQNPHEEAHDALSWRLLQPEAPFRLLLRSM